MAHETNLLKIAALFFIVYLNLNAVIKVTGQISSSITVLSTSTIPTCETIYGADSANTQRLCGDNPQDEVTSVRLNINIGPSGDPGADSLVFTAFPFGNTTIDGNPPSNPCDNVPLGQNCTALASPIYVTWKTHEVAGAYEMRRLATDVPLAYLKYLAPFVVSDDDQDIGWVYVKNDNFEPTEPCRFGAEFDSDTLYEITPCPFMGAGAFIRNEATPLCSSLNVFEPIQDKSNCEIDKTDNPCACGSEQIETFLQCGGFIDQCGGVKPDTQMENNYLCSCFPYQTSNKDHANYHWNELKQGGMHETNAMLYLDEGCSKNGVGLLSPTLPAVGGDTTSDKAAGGVLNYPNSAIAACRHMVKLLQYNNDSISQQMLSNQEPFVTVDPFSICSAYSYASTNSQNGCGFSWNSNTADCGGDSGNCYYNSGDQPRYNHIGNGDADVCRGVNGATAMQDLKCQAGRDYTSGQACNYYSRFGSLWPLSGLFVPESSTAEPIQPGVYQPTGVPCISCRYDYASSTFLPGTSGLQRKGKLWVEDFRDAWIGAYYNPELEPGDVIGSLNPINQTSGFNYYKICKSDGSDCQLYVLSPIWVSNILQSCTPLQSGDTCWNSFNQPVDFFASGSSNPAQSNIRTQGIETPLQETASQTTITYQQRGLATTPWWQDPANSNDHGHILKCGPGCDSSYGEAVTSTFDIRRLTQNVNEIGLAKGMTQLGPSCTAFAVSLQGAVVTGVDFYFSYINQSGVNVTQTLSLSTVNVGTGNNVQYLQANGAGVVGKINNVFSPTTTSLPQIGGVAVVCGANNNVQSDPGAIFGAFSSNPSSFTQNPWSLLTQFITVMEQSNLFPGITGAQKGGCAVPIPSFITLMQCFSPSTACTAPYDLCQAAFRMCENDQYFECSKYGMTPVQVNVKSGETYSVQYPGQSNTLQTCTIPKSHDAKGVSWYWLPSSMLNAFGTKCGQYGMNTYTFGKDPSTEQFICQQSFSEKGGVPCVPGISENTDVPSPCQVVGNLANFHGQTSQYAANAYGKPGSLKRDICLSDAQINFIDNTASGGADPTQYYAGCSLSGDSGFTNFTQNAQKPGLGLPPRWTITNPQYWISNGYLMSSDVLIDKITLDVTIEISGYGLNAQVTTVEGGRFVGTGGCLLAQDSEGLANLTIQNTGDAPSNYDIKLLQCNDPSGLLSNPINLGATVLMQPVSGVDPGEVRTFDFPIFISSLGKVEAIICDFALVPDAIQNLTLNTISLNCNVEGFLQAASIGQTGTDGKIAGDPNETNDSGCEGSSYGFGCWLINGGLLSKIMFIIIVIIAMSVSIVILVNVVKFNYFNARGVESSKQYDELYVKYDQIIKAQEEKEEAERMAVEKQLREQSIRETAPAIAETFASAFSRKPLMLPE
jgi:hypothetical protein